MVEQSADLACESDLQGARSDTDTAAAFKSPSTATVPKLHILVIDDDPLMVEALRQVLMADGHSVVTALGGWLGIEQFRRAQAQRQPFSLVITDLDMPDMDGRQVAAAIKSTSAHTPTILLTGWGGQLREQALPACVDVLIGKPPKISQLRATFAALIRK